MKKQLLLFSTLLLFAISCKSSKNDPEPTIPEGVEYIDLDIDGKKTKWLSSDTTVAVIRTRSYSNYGDQLRPFIGFAFEFRHKLHVGTPLKEYEKIKVTFRKKIILEKPLNDTQLSCQYAKSEVFENYFIHFPKSLLNSNCSQNLGEGNFDVLTSHYNAASTTSDQYDALRSASDACNYELSQEGSQVEILSVKPHTDRPGQSGWMIEARFKVRLYRPDAREKDAPYTTGIGKFRAYMPECRN